MAQGQSSRGWDAPAARTPFERTGGFVALGLALVLGAAVLGYLLGRGGDGDQLATGGGQQPTPAAQAADGSKLQAMLPPDVYTDCQPRELQAGQVSALRCRSAQPGVDELLVSQFADTDTMTADFAERYKGTYEDGMCGSFKGGEPGAGRTSTWGPNSNQLLACYINDNGDAVVLWEYLKPAVQVLAVRTDGDYPAVWDYWKKIIGTPLSG